MSRGRAENRAALLGPPHYAVHMGRNRWAVVIPGEGSQTAKVIEQ